MAEVSICARRRCNAKSAAQVLDVVPDGGNVTQAHVVVPQVAFVVVLVVGLEQAQQPEVGAPAAAEPPFGFHPFFQATDRWQFSDVRRAAPPKIATVYVWMCFHFLLLLLCFRLRFDGNILSFVGNFASRMFDAVV